MFLYNKQQTNEKDLHLLSFIPFLSILALLVTVADKVCGSIRTIFVLLLLLRYEITFLTSAIRHFCKDYAATFLNGRAVKREKEYVMCT